MVAENECAQDQIPNELMQMKMRSVVEDIHHVVFELVRGKALEYLLAVYGLFDELARILGSVFHSALSWTVFRFRFAALHCNGLLLILGSSCKCLPVATASIHPWIVQGHENTVAM